MSFGLALSGGGTKGAAHVGVLLALEEAGIFPRSIAGTSIGAGGSLRSFQENPAC